MDDDPERPAAPEGMECQWHVAGIPQDVVENPSMSTEPTPKLPDDAELDRPEEAGEHRTPRVVAVDIAQMLQAEHQQLQKDPSAASNGAKDVCRLNPLISKNGQPLAPHDLPAPSMECLTGRSAPSMEPADVEERVVVRNAIQRNRRHVSC